ncbi:hypothetical protein AYI98_00995 [Shewanella algae]|uniref:hypothetical protein n=1 Tax=Shewanella algae TaxID=38313 RepID=UPI00118433BA|nr:hypothetical protein [Shewanella algae]TVL53752.1 hypothetical protein AYI98_00995 [Shewanella algae]
MKLKNLILKFVNKPSPGILSSQTLYETFFYLINQKSVSKVDVDSVIDKILETQLSDGGFDIGYDFQFGPNMSKTKSREGTSPEVLSLTALGLYCERFEPSESVLQGLNLAVDWILERIVKTDKGIAIPYAPDSFKGIHITNATSFCISALAYSLPYVSANKRCEIELVLRGMYTFMHSQLVVIDEVGYWPYFYQDANGEEAKLINAKVDNYHIAQQLYHHCLAQKVFPDEQNDQIIRRVSKYLISNLDDVGYVPYTFYGERISDKVHLWGFSSLISAFVESFIYLGEDIYRKAATDVAGYISKYGIVSDHFAPIILNSDKSIFDGNFYPRSDAWVIHSLSELSKLGVEDENLIKACENSYSKIVEQCYRGDENHVVTMRMKIFAKLIRLIVK